jgi:prepilin-type N-terminal cleavage/methylation domain-containing protein
MRRLLFSGKGFSMIELIMVIVVAGIISVAVAPIFFGGFQAFFTAQNYADMNAQAELAMDRMAREIRGIDPSQDLDSATLPTASQLKFHIYNGTAQAAWVTYSLSGTNLMRNTDTLAINMSSLAFAYYKSDGTALTPPLTLAQAQSIWLVRVAVQAAGGSLSESLRTTIFLRSGPMGR